MFKNCMVHPQENWWVFLMVPGPPRVRIPLRAGNLKSGDSKKSKRRGSDGAADRERRDTWLHFVNMLLVFWYSIPKFGNMFFVA